MIPTEARPLPGTGVRRDPGSFRDPSGFVFRRDGRLYRQVDRSFADHWQALQSSGFLGDLAGAGLLVSHELVDLSLAADPSRAIAVLAPEPIDFISYPYEWTFGELRDAALLTLEVEARARAAGFTLKDASAYNVQFRRGRPILIDSLSFERAQPGRPWIAYRQFCQHFLAPLALMAGRDIRCGLLLRDYIDGLPLDLASRLLPGRSRLRFGLLSHIHLHARAERRYDHRGQGDAGSGDGSAATAGASAAETAAADVAPATNAHASGARMGGLRQAALNDSLRSAVTKLHWTPGGTEWADYAENTSYVAAASAAKDQAVEAMLRAAGGQRVWDLGANTGRFSRIAAGLGRDVLAFDIDPAAAERNYRAVRAADEERILPLVMDIANPSPGLGWAGTERASLQDRANADVILALALIHHLAISRNVPLPAIARQFADLAPEAIVEFVPKSDPMVRFMLRSREDVFPDYTIEGFRAAMAERFTTITETPLEGSDRVLFHFSRVA